MAAFDFPSSPSVNQTYTANGVTWKWNGTMWMRVSGAGYLEKIEEGNSKIEVDDSGSGNVTVTTDGTEKLRIDSSGNLGLGTQTPNKNSWNKAVTLEGSSNCAYEISDNGTLAAAFALQGNDRIELMNFRAGPLTFKTQNTERLRIDSDGRLLLGLNASAGGHAFFQVHGSGNKKAQFHQPDSGNCHIQFTNTQTGTSSNNGVEIGLGGDEQAQIWNYYNSHFRIATNNTERLRITSDGNLGIGDASPTKPLTVGTTTPVILLDDQSSRTLEIRGPSTTHNATVLTTSTHDLLLGTNNTERLRITSDGKVLIGTDTGNEKLCIKQDNTTGPTITLENNANKAYINNWGSAGGGSGRTNRFEINATSQAQASICAPYITLMTGGVGDSNEKVRITSGGNVGINRTDPNQRLNVSGNIEVNAYDNTGGGGGYNTTSGLIIGNLYDAGKSYTGSDDRTACIWQERGLDLDFATNDTLRMKLTYDGKVGLDGMTNPVAKLHIGTEDDSALTAQTVFVEGAKTGYANYTGLPQNQLCLYDNTVSTVGSGGAISFAANCGGSQQTWIAAIESQRDSSTNNASNYAGSLVFWTRPAQSTPTEKLRINSNGDITLRGTDSQYLEMASFRTTNGSSIVSGNTVFLQFTPMSNTNDSVISHSTSTNPGRITFTVAGAVQFSCHQDIVTSGSSSYMQMRILRNGSIYTRQLGTNTNGEWDNIGGTAILELNANDYIELQASAGDITAWDDSGWSSYNFVFAPINTNR